MISIGIDEFLPRAQPAPLGANDVHVWFFPEWPTQRDSAESAFVRRWLAAYAQCDAETLSIERDARGKPFLSGRRLQFNLSHSGGALVLAIRDNGRVGIDLESLERPRRVSDIARRWFDPTESAALNALPEPSRLAAFARLWSCKEALLKADGGGIADGLHRAVFRLDAAGAVVGFGDSNGFPGYSVVSFEPAVGFVGALATDARPASIKSFRFSGMVNASIDVRPIDTGVQSG